MSENRVLDIDNIARIGLMFIDGDKFEEVLLDKIGHTDYDFEKFTIVKKVLMKVEKINPDLGLTAILWQRRIVNEDVVVPLIAGNALPTEGWTRTSINPVMRIVYDTGVNQVLKRNDNLYSHYYAVKNSNAEIVGVLELLEGSRVPNDL